MIIPIAVMHRRLANSPALLPLVSRSQARIGQLRMLHTRGMSVALRPRQLPVIIHMRSFFLQSSHKPICSTRRYCSSAASESPLTPLEHYASALRSHPILANAITTGVLCAFGDGLAQLIEGRVQRAEETGAHPEGESGQSVAQQQKYDVMRTVRMGIYGVFVCGPLLAVWYRVLNRVSDAVSVTYAPVVVSGWLREALANAAPLRWAAHLHKADSPIVSPMQLLAAKVMADCFLFQAPLLNIYFVTMGILEGLYPSQILEKTQASFHQAWALSLLIWTPVQCVNLYFVPAAFQAVVVAAVNVGWKATLSVINAHSGSKAQAQAHAAQAKQAADVDADMGDANQLADENRALVLHVDALVRENQDLKEREAHLQEEVNDLILRLAASRIALSSSHTKENESSNE